MQLETVLLGPTLAVCEGDEVVTVPPAPPAPPRRRRWLRQRQPQQQEWSAPDAADVQT